MVLPRHRRGVRPSRPKAARGGKSKRRPAHVPTAAENGVESGAPDYISGGSITVSMTWITPLDALTSAVITLAPAT